jgi:hypothetical protein
MRVRDFAMSNYVFDILVMFFIHYVKRESAFSGTLLLCHFADFVFLL